MSRLPYAKGAPIIIAITIMGCRRISRRLKNSPRGHVLPSLVAGITDHDSSPGIAKSTGKRAIDAAIRC